MLQSYFELLPKFFSVALVTARKALPHVQPSVIASAGVGVFVVR
jgi:hypothetical protein